MRRMAIKKEWLILMVALLAIWPATALAYLDGVTGPTFNLVAKDGRIMMGDGTTAYLWGFAIHDPFMTWCPPEGCAQYPGPTLIVNQGDLVTVNLVNKIPTLRGNSPVNVSIVFPGQSVTASGGLPGLITREAPPDRTTVVTYTFTASNPGTYTYFSGTRPELEVEMGLVGALVVRPTSGANCPLPATQALFAFSPSFPFSPSGIDPTLAFAPIPATLNVPDANGNPVPTSTLSASRGFAYCTIDAYYDHEYLALVTELDPVIHLLVERGQMSQINNTDWHATTWFINGRNFPDTQAEAYVPWLPNQPYTALPLAHPGETFLFRFIGAGRSLHPMHPHGQNHNVIARDGRLLQTGGARVDLPISDYTTTTVPGETADAIWGPWTGARLNWDVYGHANYVDANGVTDAACIAPPAPAEYLADHCKAFPVAFPAPSKMTYGEMWGGTPFMGVPGNIPPIDPNTGAYHNNLNPMAGQSFMFHSHSEREITTNNIFIGGAATMTMIMPWTDTDGNLIIIP